jgi:hypothetical protein
MGYVMSFVGPILQAFGAGVGFLGGQDQAKQQMQMASLNFQMQQQSIQQTQEASTMQSAINQQIAANEKTGLERNANMLEKQAQMVTAAGSQNAQRTRQDYAAMLAAQRAQIAKSGVADTTGSPLSLLAETAAQEQRAVDESLFQTEGQRRGLFTEAGNQRVDAYNVGINILDSQAQAGAAKLRAQNALTQSELDLSKEKSIYAAAKRSNWAQLLNSLGSSSSSYSQNSAQYQSSPSTSSTRPVYSAYG